MLLLLILGAGEAELLRAQRRAGCVFAFLPFAEYHSPASLPAFIHTPRCDPKGLRCCRVARLSLWHRAGCQPQSGTASVPGRCQGHAVRAEATALALPGRTSLLSRVCPSQAVNGDLNRLWLICCSNYPLSSAHRGCRNESNQAAGPGGCVGAKAPSAPECSVFSG